MYVENPKEPKKLLELVRNVSRVTGYSIISLYVCVLSHSVVSTSVTSWTVGCQAPLSMEFSTQEY